MVHQQSDFLHNYKQFLDHDDVEGLRDLFTSHIAGVIVNQKPELIAGLKRMGVTNIEPSISNAQLANNITEAIYAKNKKIIDLVVSMILTNEGQSEYLNDDARGAISSADLLGAGTGASAGGASSKSSKNKREKTKLSGDQITDLVGTVGTGLGAIFGVAKSAIDAKREKQAAKNSIIDNVNQQQQIQPQQQAGDGGMSKGTIITIVVVGVVVVAAGVGFYFYNRSKAQPTTLGGGAPAAAPTTGLAGA